jgi:hypothetical protein
VTIRDGGCDFDFNPPSEPARNLGGRPPEKCDKASAFLTEKLTQRDCKACDLIDEWFAKGGAKGTVFNAKRALEADGRLVVDDSKKPQIWHLIKPGSGTVNNPDPDSFRPQGQRSRTQNPKGEEVVDLELGP